jgi:DNA-binding CsgD family transcriptional regulator
MHELPVADFSCLTPAEKAVLECLIAGRTNKEIGRILSKSEFTVKTQVQRILEKTGLDNRTQLCALAVRQAVRSAVMAAGPAAG